MPDKRPVRTITWKQPTTHLVNRELTCHILVPVKNRNVVTSARENNRRVKKRPKDLTQLSHRYVYVVHGLSEVHAVLVSRRDRI